MRAAASPRRGHCHLPGSFIHHSRLPLDPSAASLPHLSNLGLPIANAAALRRSYAAALRGFARNVTPSRASARSRRRRARKRDSGRLRGFSTRLLRRPRSIPARTGAGRARSCQLVPQGWRDPAGFALWADGGAPGSHAPHPQLPKPGGFRLRRVLGAQPHLLDSVRLNRKPSNRETGPLRFALPSGGLRPAGCRSRQNRPALSQTILMPPR